MMGPNGNGAASPPAPNAAPSAAPSPSTAPAQQPVSYIEDAYNNMLAEDFPDLPADPTQDTWSQPEPVTTPAAPTTPSYPQPVIPASTTQQQPPVPPVQQTPPVIGATIPPGAPPAPQTPDDQAALQERIRRDPFGVQADMIQRQEAQYIEALAKQVYPVSQEDVDAFLSGDGTRISQALARVHVNAVGSMLRVTSQQMPFWINNMLQTHRVAQTREDQFWQRNSYLDRAKHSQLALTTARAYRQMYPNATDEEIDRTVGAMVAVAAGVVVPPGQTPALPRAQAAPAVRTPGPVVRQTQKAFQPAGTSAPGLPRRAPQGNQWSEFADILMAEQAGRLDNVT